MSEDSLPPNSTGSYTTQETEINHGEIAWSEACTPEFMAANTDAPDFETFAKAGGFDITTHEGIDRILPSELDAYVNAHTRFPTWNEMKTRAFADLGRRKRVEQTGEVRVYKPPPPQPDISSDNQRRKDDVERND